MGEGSPRLRLAAYQAAFGDCLLLEARASGWTRRILIDGGPAGTYQAVLRTALEGLAAAGGRIDVAVVSHIDNDHISGMLDLFDDMRARRADPTPRPPLPAIDRLWHNSFGTAVGDAALEPAVRAVLHDATGLAAAMPALGRVLRGVGEGDALRADALALRIGSQPFTDGRLLADGGRGTMFDGLAVTVVGPSGKILERLRKEWMAWLAKHPKRIAAGQRSAAAAAAAQGAAVAADGSVPNLSSIALLVELGRRSILLTGDARADQVLEGMGEAGVLDAAGRRHVSILKMPHHGSIRNVSPAFLAAVTADTYVISADGRYGNPDYEALVLIVESARRTGRTIEIAMTNETESSERLRASHPPERNGYRVTVLAAGRPALLLDARPIPGAKARVWPS